MLDRQMLALTKPLIDGVARRVHDAGVSANQVTLFGFGCGVLAAVAIMAGFTMSAILPLAANRLADGLDGAVARRTMPSERGAFLDITLDFLFYAAIPLAFAWHEPQRNALAAATLLAAFIGTGTSFLAFAIMAEKRGDTSTSYPSKSFYYLGGLTEGTETIACFMLMCLMPKHFVALAFSYAVLCCITTATRMIVGWRRFA
jgi:phosphatidylglycerophosphate synthase